MDIAQELRRRRLAQGISQNKLAELTGIAQPHITRFEAGTHKATLATVEKIATALGCELTITDKH